MRECWATASRTPPSIGVRGVVLVPVLIFLKCGNWRCDDGKES